MTLPARAKLAALRRDTLIAVTAGELLALYDLVPDASTHIDGAVRVACGRVDEEGRQ